MDGLDQRGGGGDGIGGNGRWRRRDGGLVTCHLSRVSLHEAGPRRQRGLGGGDGSRGRRFGFGRTARCLGGVRVGFLGLGQTGAQAGDGRGELGQRLHELRRVKIVRRAGEGERGV